MKKPEGIGLRLEPELRSALLERANEEGESLSEIIRKILRRSVQRRRLPQKDSQGQS